MTGYLVVTVLVHGVLLFTASETREPGADDPVEKVVMAYLVVVLVWGLALLGSSLGGGGAGAG